MLRITIKILIILALIGVIGWYALVQFVQYNIITNQNFRGESLSDAFLISVGDDIFFPDKIVESPFRVEIEDKCRNTNSIRECLGVTAWHDAVASAYYAHCGFLWREQCAVFALNDEILNHDNWINLLGDVVKAPCKYFPSEKEAELRKKKHLDSGSRKKFPDVKLHYTQSWEYLGCARPSGLYYDKIIIGIYNSKTNEYIKSLTFNNHND